MTYVGWLGLPLGKRALAYGLYCTVPVLLVDAGLASRNQASDEIADRTHGITTLAPGRIALGMALLLVPAALRLLPRLPVPDAAGTDVSKYLGIATAAWCFLVIAPVPNVGYGVQLDRRSAAIALSATVGYAALALPAGLLTGFLAWSPQVDAGRLLLLPLLLLITTATAEELVFRGIVQRTIEAATGGSRQGRWTALAVASLLFGLAHLPDPRYVALATLAGAVYGIVYQRTGLLLAPILTHTLVDWTWALLLRR